MIIQNLLVHSSPLRIRCQNDVSYRIAAKPTAAAQGYLVVLDAAERVGVSCGLCRVCAKQLRDLFICHPQPAEGLYRNEDLWSAGWTDGGRVRSFGRGADHL